MKDQARKERNLREKLWMTQENEREKKLRLEREEKIRKDEVDNFMIKGKTHYQILGVKRDAS